MNAAVGPPLGEDKNKTRERPKDACTLLMMRAFMMAQEGKISFVQEALGILSAFIDMAKSDSRRHAKLALQVMKAISAHAVPDIERNSAEKIDAKKTALTFGLRTQFKRFVKKWGLETGGVGRRFVLAKRVGYLDVLDKEIAEMPSFQDQLVLLLRMARHLNSSGGEDFVNGILAKNFVDRAKKGLVNKININPSHRPDKRFMACVEAVCFGEDQEEGEYAVDPRWAAPHDNGAPNFARAIYIKLLCGGFSAPDPKEVLVARAAYLAQREEKKGRVKPEDSDPWGDHVFDRGPSPDSDLGDKPKIPVPLDHKLKILDHH